MKTRTSLYLLALAVLALVAVQSAQADSATWNGADGGNVLWSDVDNWVGPPFAVPGTTETATFDNIGFGYASIDTTGGVAIKTILFDNAGAPAYTIGSEGAIQLDNGGDVTMTSGVVNNQTVNAAINVTSTGATLSNASTTNSLTINGNYTGVSPNMVLNKTGAGQVILTGTNWIAQNADYGYSGKLTVMGGGLLTISSGTTYVCQTTNLDRGGWSYDGTVYIGKNNASGSSGNNTVTVSGTGRLWTGGLNMGGGAWTSGNDNGHNTFNLSSPGSSSNQGFRDMGKGGDSTTVIGNNTGYNVVNLSNGAFFEFANSGASMVIGQNSGNNITGDSGDYNGFTIDGANGSNPSKFNSGGSRYVTVGRSGNYNYMKVTNGGAINIARCDIGTGGDGNYITASGSGSAGVSTVNLGARFIVGGGGGAGGGDGNANNNYIKISGGATFSSQGGSASPSGIGTTGTSSNNYMWVDGSGSTMYIRNNDCPLVIGGVRSGTGSVSDAPSASGNYLAVTDGGYAYVNSVYLQGTGSKVIVGEGTSNIAQMEVRADSNAAWNQGIYLAKSDARLEINNGRLIAGQNGSVVPGAMVSGPGQVNLLGPAYFSTTYAGSTIDSVIEDSLGTGATVTKEGAGTLTLSTANTYSGNTKITAGTLKLGDNLSIQNSAFDPSGAGTLAFSSGINTPTFGGLTGSGNLTLASNVTALTLNPGTGITKTYSGALRSAAAGMTLTKTGLGTQVLAGANTYTGATTVSDGTLEIAGTGSINQSNGISINGANAKFMQNGSVANTRTFTLTQGTLGGTGTISSAIASGANVIIAPGDRSLATPAAGTLTITNAVNLAGGTTAMRLFSSTTNDCDKLAQSTTGTINFGGDLNVTQSGSWTWVANRTYDLFDWLGTKTGTFNNLYLPTLPSSMMWHDYSGGGSPVYFDYTTGNIQVDVGAGNYWAPVSGGGGSGNWDSTATVWAVTSGTQGTAVQATTGALIFTDAAGTVTVDGTVTANAGLTFETDGYVLAAGASTPNINLAGANPAANTVTTDPGVTATIGAKVTGSNGMTKDGTGTLVLSGDNTYGGATTVSNGTLLVNGSLDFNSTVAVAGGATLGGTGTIGGATIISGHHTPGTSAGVQTFGNDLTYAAGSDVTWELTANTSTNPANPNAVFDQVVVGFNLDFPGTGTTKLILKFDSPGSAVDWTNEFWNTSQSWLVYDVDTSTSNITNLALTVENWPDKNGVLFDTAQPGKYFYRSLDGADVMLNYLLPGDANLDTKVDFLDYGVVATNYGKGSTWTEGDVDGNSVVNFLDYGVIATNYGSHTPEPATLALLGLGGLGLLLSRKRK